MYREADGSDKIVAFERGMTDEEAHAAFETPGTQAYIVGEEFLVAYRIEAQVLIVVERRRLYGKPVFAGAFHANDFIEQEALAFGCKLIQDLPL